MRKDGCRNSGGKGNKGSDGYGEGNGIGDDGGDCGGDGDCNGCGAFGDHSSICGVGNAATKLMKTTTTT